MSALFTGDRNKVVMLFESGTYASTSGTGQWLGLVQEHSIDETQDRAIIRYQGADSRNVQQMPQTLIDVAGTITAYPQDWRMLAYALGSCVDAGSPSPYTHVISETNGAAGNAFVSGTAAGFLSFSIEDAKQHNPTGLNFIRTVRGAMVDSLTLSATQGEPITMEVGYVAQSVAFSSGATTAVTADTSRPYLWSDSVVHMPSGTVFEENTEWSISVNNNVEAPHYCNGSRVVGLPRELNREYEFTMTYQANSAKSKTLYDTYFQGGSEFNMMIFLNKYAAGAASGDCAIILSGCQVFPLETPGPVEGIVEHSVTIIPKSMSVSVNDQTLKYMPW